MAGKRKVDLTGQKFENWTVLGRDESKSRTAWLCRCICGKQASVRDDSLTRGGSSSCGCISKVIDLTGQKFGQLTVIKRVENNKHGHTMWSCACDCGRLTTVASLSLKSGHYKSCGCKPKGRFTDLTGRKFGDLKVIERGENTGTAATWMCACVCGNVTAIKAWSLRSGHTRSCGCKCAVQKTHGMHNTSIYVAWDNIIQRCTNPNHASWNNYGGRKIVVCAAWAADFQAFYADMGDKPTPRHSIDRIDNDKNYSCGHCADCKANGWTANCRWATQSEQMNNTRRSKKNRK